MRVRRKIKGITKDIQKKRILGREEHNCLVDYILKLKEVTDYLNDIEYRYLYHDAIGTDKRSQQIVAEIFHVSQCMLDGMTKDLKNLATKLRPVDIINPSRSYTLMEHYMLDGKVLPVEGYLISRY